MSRWWGLTTVSQQSGVKHFTLAFLETTSKTSCTLAWNGTASQSVASGRYLDPASPGLPVGQRRRHRS